MPEITYETDGESRVDASELPEGWTPIYEVELIAGEQTETTSLAG